MKFFIINQAARQDLIKKLFWTMLVTNQRQYHKHNISSSSIKFLLRNIISIENEVDIFIKVAKNSIDYGMHGISIVV